MTTFDIIRVHTLGTLQTKAGHEIEYEAEWQGRVYEDDSCDVELVRVLHDEAQWGPLSPMEEQDIHDRDWASALDKVHTIVMAPRPTYDCAAEEDR
jgi:hypothetical protein